MQIITEEQLDFEDVLILPCSSEISSRKDVDVTREYKFRWCPYIIKGTGIMNANMGTIGNFNIPKHMMKFGLFSCLHKHHDIKDLIDFYKHWSDSDEGFDYRLTFLSIGLKDNGLEKVRMIKKETGFLPSICVDVPNGYIPEVEELVRSIRSEFPDCLMMVGNVVTGDATRVLINAGADIVKIGIGGGAQCITRKQTGVGRPQFSAVVECATIAHQISGKKDGRGCGMICSDGGIKIPGDIAKAFGGGADFVMIGSLYAGTKEAEGDIISKCYSTNERILHTGPGGASHEKIYEYKKFKQFYGMSSTLAQEKFGNGKPSYRASEGRITLVPYVGSIDDVNEEFLGGLRSTMTYVGAWSLKMLSQCCVFQKVRRQLNTMYESTTIGK